MSFISYKNWLNEEFKQESDPIDDMKICYNYLSNEEKYKTPISERSNPVIDSKRHLYSRGYLLWKLLDYIQRGEKDGGRTYKELVKFYYNEAGRRSFAMGVFNSLNRYTEHKYEDMSKNKIKPDPFRMYRIGRGSPTKKRVRPNNKYFLNRAGERFLEKYRPYFEKPVNEKFTIDTDPIKDMGIGIYAYREFKTEEDAFKWLYEYAPVILHIEKIEDIIYRGSNSYYLVPIYFIELNYYCMQYTNMRKFADDKNYPLRPTEFRYYIEDRNNKDKK